MRRQLRRARLKTDPDFENVYIDETVTLTLGPRLGRPYKRAGAESTEVGVASAVEAAEEKADGNETPVIEQEQDAEIEEPEKEVVITVRQGIPAAGRVPAIVRKNEPIRRALTTMIDQNLNHLVVSQGERSRVEGIFSWQSYGCAVLAGKLCETVGDCLSQDFGEVKEERPLFDAVREIIRHGIVVVRAYDNRLCGSVTARDAAEVFVDLAEPFLFLGQIENHLRDLVNRMRLNEGELRSLIDERDEARSSGPVQVENLSLGELIRGIQKPDFWVRLNLGFERDILLKRFDQVRKIRNKVMHFAADGISPADKDYLKETRRILQEL